MTKMLSASGGADQGLCPWTPLGLCPQTPIIRSCSALAMVPPPQPLTHSAAYGGRRHCGRTWQRLQLTVTATLDAMKLASAQPVDVRESQT